MTDEPIIVGTYADPTAAHLARTQLEFEGIRAFVIDEHVVGNEPLAPQAFGWVKVMVSQADSAAARAILSRKAVGAQRACPECGSARITAHHAGRRAAILTILLLGFPIGRARSKFRCEDCGHSWRGSS